MELPTKLPKQQKYKMILGEFYDAHKNKQWFHKAELDENHPTHMRPTIILYCAYTPAFEMKEIIQFAGNKGVGLEVISLDYKD